MKGFGHRYAATDGLTPRRASTVDSDPFSSGHCRGEAFSRAVGALGFPPRSTSELSSPRTTTFCVVTLKAPSDVFTPRSSMAGIGYLNDCVRRVSCVGDHLLPPSQPPVQLIDEAIAPLPALRMPQTLPATFAFASLHDSQLSRTPASMWVTHLADEF